MAVDYTIKAYPTTYNSIRFRSRLEATWAAFFDLLEWPWEYEPFDLGSWSPDFLIKGAERDALVEVKPSSMPDSDVVKKITQAAPADHCLMLCGLSPHKVSLGRQFVGCLIYSTCCGSSRQQCWSPRTFVKFGDRYDVVFGHRNEHWGLVTGCTPADGIDEFVGDEIERLWGAAKNKTQWRPM
jgi:hypothetical protein